MTLFCQGYDRRCASPEIRFRFTRTEAAK
jgi:hypothetical protein